ncbi:hypothetical protein BU17DRAFT_95752 [Hysterangium stoloniferum]|nr:hypothetical protein BU17DRAFT_95752 [Hysterangium stoloniferum]
MSSSQDEGMASSSQTLDGLPESVLETLVSQIMLACPSLTSTLLSGMGKRVHSCAVRTLFTSVTLHDDARHFMAANVSPLASQHPLQALLSNPERVPGSLGLVTIDEDEEDSDSDAAGKYARVAVQPMSAKDLAHLLSTCVQLEEFLWISSNLPPDGIGEVLADNCSRLSAFMFVPEPPLRAALAGTAPSGRPNIPKWDAPSLSLLASLPLTKLHITRLSQSGARSLMAFFSQLGEESLLEDVKLDFLWLDDPLCEKLVEAGRKIKRLDVSTSGTKLTDKSIINIFDGCDSLETFGLIEAQGRLTRNLWSKIDKTPPRLHTLKVCMSESGPHHSWTADHLLSLSHLQLQTISHLTIMRLTSSPQQSASGTALEYNAPIDDVAILKVIPKDLVAAIKEATALTVLECDWWSWKPEDVKTILERCTQLEYLKLAFDAPFAKLLTLTSVFIPLTNLLKLSICIPYSHSPGLVPALSSPLSTTLPCNPLTPAASPVRRRTSLPSPVTDFASQVFVADDSKHGEQADPSLPPIRDVKRFVKKCPRLTELEWYGRNGRGRWLVSRSVATSKINTNVSVKYYPPLATQNAWNRAILEKNAMDAIHAGSTFSHNIERNGQAWTGPKAEQFFVQRTAEKDREDVAAANDRAGRSNGNGKRCSISLTSPSGNISLNTDRKSNNSVSPVMPYTPLSPRMQSEPFTDLVTVSTNAEAPSSSSPQSTPPRGTSSEPPPDNGNVSGRVRRTTPPSPIPATPGSPAGRGRGGNAGREGRGRGGHANGKSGGRGSRRNGTGDSGGSSRNGGSNGRGHGTARGGGGKRKTTVRAT